MVALLFVIIGLQAQYCVPPTGLQTSVHTPEWRNVHLNWTAAVDASQQTFGYGTTNSSSVSNGNDYTAVIRLTPTELASYSTRYLSAVQFKPAMHQSDCEYTLYVWQGGSVDLANEVIDPGTLMATQPITQTLEIGSLNTVALETPLAVDPTQEIWIGVRANRLIESGFPIGTSYNASVDYKGNVLYNGSTWSLLNVASQPNNTNWYMFAVFAESAHLLSGYNVYRDNVLLTTTAAPSFIDSLENDGTYTYSVAAAYNNGCESSALTATVTMNNDCFISSFPYTENFEGVTGTTLTTVAAHVLPNCWSWANHGATYPGLPSVYNSSSYASSGVNSLRFSAYNTSANNTTYADQYAILPPIDVNVQPVSALQMEFDARCWSTTSTYQLLLEVGVMTSLSDITTFVPVDTIQCTGATYGNYIVNFSNYQGNGQYIAFRVPKLNTGASVYNAGAIDNILLDVIPTCPKPTSLLADATLSTETSITLGWTENGSATEWMVEYGTSGFVPGNGTAVSAMTNPVVVSGLSASTPYNFYVRSVCAAGDTSHYSGVLTASTACGPLSSLPYRQNFDSYMGATSGSTSNIEQSCWTQISTGTISTYAGYPIIYNSSTYANSGTNAVRFYTYTTTTYGDEYAVMPAVDVTLNPMNTLQVEFAANKYSTYSLNLIVGVMDDSATVASFVPVDTIVVPSTTASNEYLTFIVSFENYTGNGTRVAFKAPRPIASYNAGCIDDIILSTIPNCRKPMNVAATAISFDEVTVDWLPYGDETNWDVVVVATGASADAGTAESVTEHPYTILNLNPNTTYDVYVRANCGGDVSPWSNVYTFTTRCTPYSTFPFVENFDAYPATSTAASGVIPTCWAGETNYSSNYPYIYSTQHASGTGSLYFYSTSTYYSKATSPALDLSNYEAGELTLSFKALKTSAAYGNLNVYLATNPYNESTYTLLKSLTSSDYLGTSMWTEQNVVIANQYTTPVYLVFEAPVSVTNYVCVDDVMIDETPECTSPRYLSVSNIHGSNAQVNWEQAWFGAESYAVEYAEAGTENWSTPETTTGTSFLLSGLEPMTSYDVKVTSNCAAGSAAPVTTTFLTTCLVPEEVAIGSGTSTSYYIPFYGAYQYSYSQQLYTAAEMQNEEKDISTISFQYTGDNITRTVDIYLLNTTETTLASAWAPMTGAQLVFSGDVTMDANAGTNNWNTIVLDTVFHYDGTSNLLIAVNNRSTVSAGTSASTKTFKYSSATGKGRYVYGGSTATSPYNPFNMTVAGTSYAYHNNIIFGSCNTSTTCAAPIVTVTDVTDQTISLSWIPGYHETAWELEYKTQSAADWNNEGTVSEQSYTLANLATNTPYEIRVRALCTDTSAWNVVTAQTYCNSVNVPYTQNFETATASGVGNFIDCWIRGTNSTSAYPYTSSTQANAGTYSVYFYGTSSYYSYAATPRFDDSVVMDSLQVRFWARKSSAAYNIQVGIMTNPYDYSTFELLATVTPDEINTWQELQINTSGYTGNGRFVAFRCPNTATNYMYVDDILIQHIPNCPRVQDVATVNLQAHQTDITWTSSEEASTWYYMYGLKDSVIFDVSSATMTSEDTVSLTNLLSNTEYDIFVMAVCDNGEEAEVVKFTFTTLCDPIATLPYRESFDNYGGSGQVYYPSCWSRAYFSSAGVNTSYPYVYSTYFNSAPACLYMYGLTSSSSYSMAVVQPVDDNIAINTLQVDLSLRTTTLSYYLLVGVMNGPEDYNSFTPVDTLHVSATSTFEPKSVSFASYTGTGKYIAFKNFGSMYVDDVVVDYIPACDNPTDLTVSNLSQTDATIDWTAGSTEDSWEVYVVPTGGNVNDATPAVVTNNSYMVTGLTAATTYDVYVRANCPIGYGHSGYLVGSFTTQCNAVNTLPISENFDGVTGATTGTLNNLPTCWNYWNQGTVSSYQGYPIVYNSSTYAASGANSLRFYVYSTSSYTPQYAVLPQIDTTTIPLNTLAIEFDMRMYSTSYANFTLEVGVMSDPAVDSSFVPVDTVVVTSTTYSHQVVYLNNYQGGGSYIALKAPVPTTAYNTGQVDNLVVDLMPSCLRVGTPTASAVTNNSVTVSWTTSGNESAWIVNYKAATDTVWQSDVVNSTSYVLSGLTANTTYQIQVIADCGSSQAAPSNTISVTTDCEDMVSLPYTENFDNYTASTTGTVVNLPTCWHQMNLGYSSSTYSAYPIMYNSTTYAFSGSNSLRFYTYNSASSNYGEQWAILRGFDPSLVPVQSLQLKLKSRKYSTSYPFDLTIGVMSDYSDTSTFVPVATISPAGTDYEEFTVYFRQCASTGKYIAMKAAVPSSSYNAGYVDNLEVSLAPSCLPVQNLSATAVTANSIDIAWDALGDETAWNVCYRVSGDTAWNTVQAMNTPSYSFTNLQSSTNYQFKVQPDCGGGEVAAFTPVLNVATACLAIDVLPYTENFDSYVGTTYSVAGVAPICWETFTDNSARPAPHIIGSGSYWYPQSQPNALSFVGSNPSTNAVAVLPEFTAALNTLQVSFAYRMESAAQGTLKVGYVTDIANVVSSFVEVATITSATTISMDSIDFSAVTGTGRIAFLWNYVGTSFYSCNIDNVVVSALPVAMCDAPTNVAANNITANTANVNWTAGGNENAWYLQYKTAASADWSNSIAVTSVPSHTLTGLTPETAYDVRVQANCGAGETSEWATATFTTADASTACETPTNLTASSLTIESAVLDWDQADTTVNTWTINYKKTDDASWSTVDVMTHPFTLTGLEYNTNYQVKVAANCEGTLSDFTAVVTFKTLGDGIQDLALANSITLYPNPTSGAFSIRNAASVIEAVEVYDVYGKLLNRVVVNDTQVTMSASEYAAGMYFVKVYTDGGVVTKSFIKK